MRLLMSSGFLNSAGPAAGASAMLTSPSCLVEGEDGCDCEAARVGDQRRDELRAGLGSERAGLLRWSNGAQIMVLSAMVGEKLCSLLGLPNVANRNLRRYARSADKGNWLTLASWSSRSLIEQSTRDGQSQ